MVNRFINPVKYVNSQLNKNNNVMKVQIINKSKHDLPQYATPLSAGMDLRANLDAPVTLKPLQRCLIPTGLYIALPDGYEAQIRPRSGLALKKGITLLNTPGTIDADYRGEIGVILVNLRPKISWSKTVNGLHRWSLPGMKRRSGRKWRYWMRQNVVPAVSDIPELCDGYKV